MLTIVGTPIGNLQDISLRQAESILGADIILTEDTRSTGILKSQLVGMFDLEINPSQRLISYYKEREFEKLPDILEQLETDQRIVLVSESGMPLVSDPGYLLVQKLIQRNIPFEVVPGPTAATTAIVYSGFDPTHFAFLGFLPKKTADCKKLFEKLQVAKLELSYIFYESPRRIVDTLKLLEMVAPDCDVCICRELTKKFEEISRGKPAELASREYRGEITVIIRFTGA